MTVRKEYKMKICLLGEPAVGKTSLINKFVINKFDDKYISTLGTKVSKKNVLVKIGDIEADVTLMIWDVLGQSQFKNVVASALNGAKGALIVCDSTRLDTFNKIEEWIKRLYISEGTLPIVLLANKTDLVNERKITSEQLQELADKYNCPNYFTSAKTGEHVENAFKGIAKEMVMHALGIKAAPSVSSQAGSQENKFDIFDLEDSIINLFCDVMGGQDFAMPIVRQQFKRVGMDFREPNLPSLKNIAVNLQNIVKDFKSPDDAQKFKHDLNILISGYESKKQE